MKGNFVAKHGLKINRHQRHANKKRKALLKKFKFGPLNDLI